MSQIGAMEARGGAQDTSPDSSQMQKLNGENGSIIAKYMAVGLGVLALAGAAFAAGRNTSSESNGNNQSAGEAQQALCSDIQGITGLSADYNGYRISSGKNINLGPASPGSEKLDIKDYLPTSNVAVDETKAVSPYIAMMKELLDAKDTDGNGGFTDDHAKDVIAAANVRKLSYDENGVVDTEALRSDCQDVSDELNIRFDISSRALQKGVKYVEYIEKENENGDVSYDTHVFASTEDVAGMIDTKEASSLRVIKGKDQDGEFDGSIRVFTEYNPSKGATEEKLEKHHKVVKRTFINRSGQKVTVKQVVDTRTGRPVPVSPEKVNNDNNASKSPSTGGGKSPSSGGGKSPSTGGGKNPAPVTGGSNPAPQEKPETPAGDSNQPAKTPEAPVPGGEDINPTPPPVVVTPAPTPPPKPQNPKGNDPGLPAGAPN